MQHNQFDDLFGACRVQVEQYRHRLSAMLDQQAVQIDATLWRVTSTLFSRVRRAARQSDRAMDVVFTVDGQALLDAILDETVPGIVAEVWGAKLAPAVLARGRRDFHGGNSINCRKAHVVLSQGWRGTQSFLDLKVIPVCLPPKIVRNCPITNERSEVGDITCNQIVMGK